MAVGTTHITHQQAIDAVQIVFSLADDATSHGMASELRLGRQAIEQIVALRDAIQANDTHPIGDDHE